MNTYKTEFFATCPNNNLRIKYTLLVETQNTIIVENILRCIAELGKGFHEDIADELHDTLGGVQTLIADHHGVTIETKRP